jgi:hypothetical protein
VPYVARSMFDNWFDTDHTVLFVFGDFVIGNYELYLKGTSLCNGFHCLVVGFFRMDCVGFIFRC